MNFQQLRAVRETTRSGFNLTDVADVLHTSQPGISRQIRELEDELGIEIFVRVGKRLTRLTPPGEAVLPIVERLLLDADNLRRVGEEFSTQNTGRLSIAATHSQARYALPTVVRDFRRIYPQVSLHLHQGSPKQVAEMLLSGEADIGVAMGVAGTAVAKEAATMVLTEPDAGSDVGAGRTKAVQQPDGTWHITGVKRFITSAEADFYDNVVHFVLARPEGGGAGTKGLSLFVVPKWHVDLETGELGERNGAYVTNVEHKMGLKASTTCEITFGDKQPAVGTLVGDAHDGIAQMFKIIEFARMMVGTKAIATLSAGYLNALAYAKTRVQGADLTQMTDKTAPRVTITHHPDVRRSLMLQKAYAEGLRALVLFTACQQDTVDLAGHAPGEGFEPGTPQDLAARLNDLLLPLVKGCGSERAWVLLGTESLQTFGGSGFLQDYPIEQYVRDAKIDTLYEGTTAIQGLDFFFRKIIRDKGKAVTYLSTQIQEFVKGADGAGESLVVERELLGKGLEDLQGILGFMVGELMNSDPRAGDGSSVTNLYKVGQNTSRLLLCAGDLVVGWLLLRQAEIAQAALDSGTASARDQKFYEGKIAAASFFARTVLPKIAAERQIAEATDNSLMDVSEDSF